MDFNHIIILLRLSNLTHLVFKFFRSERVMDQVNTRYGKIRPNQIKKFFLIKFLFFGKKCSENKILVKKNFMKNFMSNFLQIHLSCYCKIMGKIFKKIKNIFLLFRKIWYRGRSPNPVFKFLLDI